MTNNNEPEETKQNTKSEELLRLEVGLRPTRQPTAKHTISHLCFLQPLDSLCHTIETSPDQFSVISDVLGNSKAASSFSMLTSCV